MEQLILLPEYVKKALSCLTVKGFSAYVVGGCVRDSLLRNTPTDWDICTSALPQQVSACFPYDKVLPTGLTHGTVTVLHGDNPPMQITTFRTESHYSDHRHPDAVQFTTNLEADLHRRDFTINAMAYSPQSGIVDPLGGQADLRRQLLRTVGQPAARFGEDALRLLRAVRFQAVLGFAIEPDTKAAMAILCHTLHHTAVERQCAELSKLLCAPYATLALKQNQQLLRVILPELRVFCLELFACAPALLHLRLSALLYPLHPRTAQVALQRLRFDSTTTRQVCTLLTLLQSAPPLTSPAMKLLLRDTSVAMVQDYLRLTPHTQAIPAAALLTEILQTGQCYNRQMLAISGKDLQAVGFPQGKKLGAILDTLLHQVITEALPNQKQHLLNAAKNQKGV